MKRAGCITGAILVFVAFLAAVFGFMFIVGSPASQDMPWFWAGSGICLLLISLILVLIAAVVLIKAYRDANRPEKSAAAGGGETTIIQKVDITGDLSLEKMKCQSCGATLSKDSITTRAGAVVIDCPYCGTSYEIEEEPKW